jgi:hypothetical protein
MLMNNQQAHERIHKLLHDGKINPEEATALLEALHDGDTASSADTDTEVTVTSHSTSSTTPSTTSHKSANNATHNATEAGSTEAGSTDTPVAPPEPPQPPRPPHTQPKSQPKSQREVEINLNGTIGNAVSEVFSRGFRYAFGMDPDGTASSIPNPDLDVMPEAPFVYVHNRLGNVTIKVDATLTEPHITPKASANDEADTEDTEDNPKADIFRPHDQDDNYPEDVFMVRLLTRADSTLHIPDGYAVYLDSSAGNVRMADVARVFGTVNAGNAKISGVTSLNMVVNAGNAKVSGRFEQGEHKLVTNAGNAKVMLQEGSSLTVSARVSAGNIKHKGNWQDVTVVREMVSSKLEGRIHTGDATMTLKAKAGNISVYAPDGTDNTGDDSDDSDD